MFNPTSLTVILTFKNYWRHICKFEYWVKCIKQIENRFVFAFDRFVRCKISNFVVILHFLFSDIILSRLLVSLIYNSKIWNNYKNLHSFRKCHFMLLKDLISLFFHFSNIFGNFVFNGFLLTFDSLSILSIKFLFYLLFYLEAICFYDSRLPWS